MTRQEPPYRQTENFPLTGVSVLDMTTSYAGPTATMYLADMGADVIKLERPPYGDDCRSWGPPFQNDWSAWYVSANRNKRSLCLDVSAHQGRAVLDRLLAGSDVFIQNINPSKLERLRLDPETLHEAHPHLVYCAISGFGLTGEDRDLPGYDLIAQARSGLMSVTGPKGGLPERVSTALTDIVAGITAAFAISAALVGRGEPPRGSAIDVGLLDVALAMMAPRITSFLAGEREPAPSGATDSVLAIYQTFETLDRPIVLAIGNERMWTALCEVLGLSHLGTDVRYGSNEGRRRSRTTLVAQIQGVLATRPADEWIQEISAKGVPVAPVNFLTDVVSDPHVKSRGSLTVIDQGDAEPFTAVAHPWRFAGGVAPAPATPPSRLGADNVDILKSVGIPEDEINSLSKLGIVWQSNR